MGPVASAMTPGAGGLSPRQNLAWTLAGHGMYTASRWAILVVLARSGTAEAVGQFALGVAIATPVTLCANLYLSAVLATDRQGERIFGDYLGLRLVTTVLAAGVIVVLALAGGYRSSTRTVILLVGASKAIDAVIDLFLGLFQRHERMDYFGTAMIVSGWMPLLGASAAVLWTRNVVWTALAFAVGSAMALLVYTLPVGMALLRRTQLARVLPVSHGSVRPRWDRRSMNLLARRAAPLGFASLRFSLNVNIPRYFIVHRSGEQVLGIFAAVAALGLAGSAIGTALGQSSLSRLASHHAAGDKVAFRRLLAKILAIGLAVGTGLIAVALAAGRWLLAVFLGPAYAEHGGLLVWLMLITLFYLQIALLEVALTAMGEFRVQMRIQIATLVLLLLLCGWLTGQHGVYGATIAMLVTAVVTAAGYGAAVAVGLARPPAGGLPC